MSEPRPLSDVRVLDAGQVIAGPVCGVYLADLGADVIKLEAPTGDILRGGQDTINGEPVNPSFELVNRNKRSISIDLKSNAGQEIIHDIIDDVDVFLQNWPPGVADRLGVGYETLHELNPELVYTHITGYGESGPMANQPAMDAVIQHVSGLSSLMGYESHPPIRAQSSLADYYAGTNAAVATLGALWHRDRGYGGQKVEISMLEAMMHNMDSAFEHYNNFDDFSFQKGERSSYKNPTRLYGAAETKDGWICVAFYLNSDAVWNGFCELLDRPDLQNDSKYGDPANRLADGEKFSEMLETWLRNHTTSESLERLQQHGIPVAPHNSVPETAEMEHIREREIFREISHDRYGKFTLTRPPFRLSKSDPDIRRHAPRLGEHTNTILADLGISTQRLNSLQSDGIIGSE